MSPKTYANALCALKVFFRDFMGMEEVVRTFRFPRRPVKLKMIPSKAEVQRFYYALKTPRARALFLMYATTGLRKSEVLSLKMEDLDLERRMVIPARGYSGQTKHSWVSFFNTEAEEALRAYLASRKYIGPKVFPIHHQDFLRIWREAYKETGIHITPQVLREWFACEMGKLGVPDRYVDAFCGRVPRSVLARHYTDYSPERLKEIYVRAGLKVLS